MINTVIKNWENTELEQHALDPNIFGLEVREDILHRVVTWQLSKARSGCHKTKQRNEVSGSTRKIYKQKGTGQARHGSIKAPIFIGGGITFGPVTRSHEYSLNKKVRALGLRYALSSKYLNKCIIVLDSLKLDSYKTTNLNKKLENLGIKSALIVDNELDQNLINSSASLINIDVIPVIGINVYDILQHQVLIISKEAIDVLEKRLAC